MASVDVAVIGAGVTGLASSLALSRAGYSTCVLERHSRAGLDCSTHNSGVIHAGLYYPPDSLKSRLCLTGRPRLYAFCARHDVPHERCGKLVVATRDDERPALEALYARAIANGVEELQLVDRAFIARREPSIDAVAAIFSPASGIVEPEALVRTLARLCQAEGVILLPATRLTGADPAADGMRLRTAREVFHARAVVNAAGLYADEVSQLLGARRFTIHPCRGEYAELTPQARGLVKALVYPLPHPKGHGLGVHLTRSVSGNVWLGPTVRFQERKDDYEGDRLEVDAFVAAARALLPSLETRDVQLAGSGIRPKLHPASDDFADFLIERDRTNPLVIHAAGIESPGLTSCLAIGDLVCRLTQDVL